MITNARIAALRADPDSDLGWLTALRAPAIKQLAAAGGPLQPTLFDQHNLAEITHPDYPGERLIACRNPFLAEERARKRSELLAATEELLAPITAAVNQGRLVGADRIGLRVGKIIDKYKMAKHLHLSITDTSLTITRKTSQIAAEAALDGIYVLRTSVPAATLDAAGVVTAYKSLAKVERDFRSLKSDCRPASRGQAALRPRERLPSQPPGHRLGRASTPFRASCKSGTWSHATSKSAISL